MSDKPQNPQAFPRPGSNWQQDETYRGNDSQAGVTLRDWFAGQALPVAWSAYDKGYFGANDDPNKKIAECAYQLADAMLQVRN